MEIESENLRHSIKFSALNSLEHYEIMRDKIRIAAWKEFTNDLYRIIIYGYQNNNDKEG